ncbi:MAG: glycerol-3-phosphate dehydrogenase, partial [Betaproteobacteria bacterium]
PMHPPSAIRRHGQRCKRDRPVTQAVCRVRFDGLAPGKAVEALLNREPKAENGV